MTLEQNSVPHIQIKIEPVDAISPNVYVLDVIFWNFPTYIFLMQE